MVKYISHQTKYDSFLRKYHKIMLHSKDDNLLQKNIAGTRICLHYQA